MIATAVLLIGLGVICLTGTIISVIFTIINFANNKPQKYSWLTAFLICIVALVTCVVLFVKKAITKVQDFTHNSLEQFEDFSQNMEGLSDSLQYKQGNDLRNSPQIKTLKSYAKDSSIVPDQFYYYLGFSNYYRFPLRYPYAIHCNDQLDNGELFNEKNAIRFDENDNGEISTNINYITKLVFDKSYLLIEQNISSDRSEKVVLHFILFSFDTEKKEEASSEKELFKLAKQKGYTGADTLMTIDQYDQLF